MNGRHYVAWRPNISQFFDSKKALLAWAKWPSNTPTGDELREWLEGLEREDRAKQEAQKKPEPDLAGGFGPECHLDESDPNFRTRQIV